MQVYASRLRSRGVVLAAATVLGGLSGCTRDTTPQALIPFTSMVANSHSVAVHGSTASDSLEVPSRAALIGDQIYILDKASVKVVNVANGTIVRAFGNLGDGVGDFRQPASLVPLDSGRLAILDRSRSVISIRDSTGTVLKEFGIGTGYFNSILVGPREQTFLLTGTRPLARGKAMDLHEFDAAGRRLESNVPNPSWNSAWARRFSAAFGVRVGGQVAVGALASNEIRLFDPRTRAVHSFRVAPRWYRSPVWPPDTHGADSSMKVIAQQSNEWRDKQTLMNAIFAMTGGRMLVSFRDFTDAGAGSYFFAIADTAGRTLAVSQRTDAHVLAVRGDTVIWVTRDSTKHTVLGSGVLVVPRSPAGQ